MCMCVCVYVCVWCVSVCACVLFAFAVEASLSRVAFLLSQPNVAHADDKVKRFEESSASIVFLVSIMVRNEQIGEKVC